MNPRRAQDSQRKCEECPNNIRLTPHDAGVIGDPVGNGHRRHDVQVVRWNHKSDWRWVIGNGLLDIGYWLLGMGNGLFQVFVYGIDANACREETEGSYVDMVGIG